MRSTVEAALSIARLTAEDSCAGLPEPTQVVTADEILRASQTGEQLILDARPDRRFVRTGSGSQKTERSPSC